MGFENLSADVQNLITYSVDHNLKLIFLFIFLSFSVFYIFYYKKYIEKSTALWSVMVIRTTLTGFCFFGIVFSPFILLTLNPQYAFQDFFGIFGIIYLFILLIVVIVASLDFYKWAFILILRMAGIKSNTEEYNKFLGFYKTYIKK